MILNSLMQTTFNSVDEVFTFLNSTISGIVQSGLVALYKIDGALLVDVLGSSTVTFTNGDASDFENSTFQFEYNIVMAEVDTKLGGGIIFSGTTPIPRSWIDWCSIVNQEYLFVGYRGIAAYNITLDYNTYQAIRSYLLCPTIMLDNLIMNNTLRMI